jgi:hypothetical protein
MAYADTVGERQDNLRMPSEHSPDQPQLGLPDPAQLGPQLGMVVENDRKAMHLRIGQDGKLVAGIVLSAEQVEGLMAGLAQVRDRMLPAPAPKAEPVQSTPVEPAPVEPATLEQAPPEAVSSESTAIEFSDAVAQQIKGTHYDFGIDANTQQLIFSVRDQTLGWLSFRFGVRLLERMLKVARSAQKS